MPGKFAPVRAAKTGGKPARSAPAARKPRVAKSTKADGTPKKRWSAAERSARGIAPRRGGGQPRARTRDDAPVERETRSFSERETVSRPPRREFDPSARRDDSRPPRRSENDRRDTGGFGGRDSSYKTRNETSYANRDERPARRPEHQRPTRSAEFTPRTSTVLARAERPVRVRPVVEARPSTGTADFDQLGLPPTLVNLLREQGIVTPFPIQAATIPDALAGRDILGRGQTGSGKTLAFGLPMVTRLSGGSATKLPRGLVLVPTRELAMQVLEALNPLARTAGLSTILVAGGMSYTPQLRAFGQGVDIVVATPGRLIDLMDQNAADLSRVEVTVLDEADHMADLGFMPAVTQILDVVPGGGQRMLFSATLDRAIDRLVKQYLDSPVTHEVDGAQASVTTMEHYVLHTAPKDKSILTAEIASRPGRTLVFVRTQRGADRVAEQLRAIGVMAGALHGGLAQGARTRVLEAFKDGQVPVLVATDVAARGIHVDEIGLVLQADPPGGPKEYLHRAGRTARAGGTGVVVTLVLPHQRREISAMTSQAGVRAGTLPAESNNADLNEATGAQVPTGRPIPDADYERIISPPAARRRPGGGGGSDRPRGRGARDGGRSFSRSRHGDSGPRGDRGPRG
jgi:superfamily II DNA/RNA helicase